MQKEIHIAKSNKSELLNRFSYKCLPYLFEVKIMIKSKNSMYLLIVFACDHCWPKIGSPKAKGFAKLGHNRDSCVTYYSDVNRDPS